MQTKRVSVSLFSELHLSGWPVLLSGTRKTAGGTERRGILVGQCALRHREDPVENDSAEKGTRAAHAAAAV